MSTTKKGKEGEKLAAAYLENAGYEVLEYNYRYKRGEIDLVVKKDNLLVFVEVKSRSSSDFGNPEDAVSINKAEMVITTAENYIIEKKWDGPIRFDIISIHTQKYLPPAIHHFEDAFY